MLKNFTKPKVVLSRCVEFDSCRWNGAMISSPVVRKFIGFFDFITVCPEYEIGLGVPRKPVRLILKNGTTTMIQRGTGADLTKIMRNYSDGFLYSLKDVDGFILKDRSPSCGIKDVKIYACAEDTQPLSLKGSGLFGEKSRELYGHLAIETEGRLNDNGIRDLFLTKLYALAEFRVISQKPSIKGLVDYHSDNKYLFMSYNQSALKCLGKIVSNPFKEPVISVFDKYVKILPKVFSRQCRKGSVVNVLLHGFGYFSKKLSKRERDYFLGILDKYSNDLTTLSECRSVLMSWIIRFDENYLARQTFFSPYPETIY